MDEQGKGDLDSDLRLRLSEPMLSQSLRPIADTEKTAATAVSGESLRHLGRRWQSIPVREPGAGGVRELPLFGSVEVGLVVTPR